MATPEWYTQMFSVFFSIFAISRMLNPTYEYITILLQIGTSLLITMGISGSVCYQWQKWINIGSSLPEDWDYPGKKSEFAINIFGLKLHFWWKRPFAGKQRKIINVIGIVSIIIGITLLFFI